MNRPTLRTFVQKTRDQRWRIARNRLRLEREFIARTGKRRPTQGRILSYHSTGTPEWGVNDVSASRFIEQIDRATVLGHRFVAPREIAAGRGQPKDLAITFDDGLRSILGVTSELEARGIPFEVFVVTEWAAEQGGKFLSWEDLDGLRNRGAMIGSHSVSHANFRSLNTTQRRYELQHAREEIVRHLGSQVDEFAIPFGRSLDWDAECTSLALEAGYTAIYAQSEDLRPDGTAPRSFITKYDRLRHFEAVLDGRFDGWEERF